MAKTIVVKVGGSTWESRDAALEDIVGLQRQGHRTVVVHGGGKTVDQWLKVHGVESEFLNGLRVTSERALPVVIAVLAGYTNKQLVAGLKSLGIQAWGLSGVDVTIWARRIPGLGYVGEVESVNVERLRRLLDNGDTPVIAPLGMDRNAESSGMQILNINADTVAGEVAIALEADSLVFLTNVAGVLDADGKTLERLSASNVDALVSDGTISQGMLPKVEACLKASAAGCEALIIDGRQEGALRSAVEGQVAGTRVG